MVAAQAAVAIAGKTAIATRAESGFDALMAGSGAPLEDALLVIVGRLAVFDSEKRHSHLKAVCMDKRQRERVRKQKQQQKEQRRAERAAERQKRALEGGKDTDLEGIVPGPQPGQIVEFDPSPLSHSNKVD